MIVITGASDGLGYALAELFEKDLGRDSTENGEVWMNPNDVAYLIKQTLDLPKSMEVSEIVINRKQLR